MKIDDREFSLILPKFDNTKVRKIKPEVLKEFSNKISEHFGGVTIRPSVLGCWFSSKTNKLECEENIILSAVRDSETTPNFKEQIEKDREFMNKLSEEAGIKLGQESVMIFENLTEGNFVEGVRKDQLPKNMIGIDFFNKLI